LKLEQEIALKKTYYQLLWCGDVMSGVGLVMDSSQIRIPVITLTWGKLFIYVDLCHHSPSSITWYWPKGSDSLCLGR